MTTHNLTIKYEEYDSSDKLSGDEQGLIKSAWEARQHAHAPYSNFFVGASVLTRNGLVLKGSNQETANYKGSCAEKVALDSSGVAGVKNHITKIAVVGGPQSLIQHEKILTPEEPITPCGQCRQDIKEVEDMSGEPITIILASRNVVRRIIGIKNLLPFAFGPSDLGITFKR